MANVSGFVFVRPFVQGRLLHESVFRKIIKRAIYSPVINFLIVDDFEDTFDSESIWGLVARLEANNGVENIPLERCKIGPTGVRIT
jgi:hypothetical protein